MHVYSLKVHIDGVVHVMAQTGLYLPCLNGVCVWLISLIYARIIPKRHILFHRAFIDSLGAVNSSI